MTDLAKRTPIRSQKLRNAARGEKCVLNLPGICNFDPETVVLAHLHDETFGKSIKADDTSGIHLCSACHVAIDEHRTGLPDETLFKMLLRGLQRTIRNLVMRGIIFVPQDAPKQHKPSPRKPKDQRQSIARRKDAWPPKGTQRIQSANRLARKSKKERI